MTIKLTREEAQQLLDALEWAERRYSFAELELFNRPIETLRAKLIVPEPEPVAYDFQKALFRAYHLGQRYWADADSESYSANKRADKHRQDFDALCEEVISYTAPPQREWQGLTDMEIVGIATLNQGSDFSFARAIEAKLREKNNG